jgi:hypothetical protein
MRTMASTHSQVLLSLLNPASNLTLLQLNRSQQLAAASKPYCKLCVAGASAQNRHFNDRTAPSSALHHSKPLSVNHTISHTRLQPYNTDLDAALWAQPRQQTLPGFRKPLTCVHIQQPPA